MSDDSNAPARMRWARLRFQIIGQLLGSPPEPGELKGRIAELAGRPWRHPTTGGTVHFSDKTIERWFYNAGGGTESHRGARTQGAKALL